jgi:pimeloyl-ACP methyl ester carboxylesterase
VSAGLPRVALWVAVAVAAVLAVSLWTFWLTVRPPRIAVPGHPRDYRLAAEDFVVTTDDGLRLAAWLVPRGGPSDATAGRRAIVLLHGYPANKADMLPMATALAPHFTVVLVDLRYFGGSEGAVTTLGSRERRDLARVLDALAGRGITEVGVFGYSLGGAVGLLAAAEDARIRAVVAYAPFADLRVLGRDLYAGLWLLKYPLVELMVVWSRLFLGADITRPSPAEAARRLAIPVLLVHSRDDEQIPFAHAGRLRAALAGNPRATYLFTGGGHNDGVPDLERRVAEFFVEHLGREKSR